MKPLVLTYISIYTNIYKLLFPLLFYKMNKNDAINLSIKKLHNVKEAKELFKKFPQLKNILKIFGKLVIMYHQTPSKFIKNI